MTSVLMLRHGKTASHRGNTSLTAHGKRQAEEAGRRLAERPLGRCLVLTSALARARESGLEVLRGLGSVAGGPAVTGRHTTWGLRNPDLYLASQRVEMVSSAEDFAAQVPGLDARVVFDTPFYAGFLAAADRIGFWLRHADPPGEAAAAVGERMAHFVSSLAQCGTAADTVICVTHSPILRAMALRLLGADPGEPEHLEGLALDVATDGAISCAEAYPSRTGHCVAVSPPSSVRI